MRQAVLLGNADTKRTDYFRQAAAQAELPFLFIDWKEFDQCLDQWKARLPQAEWLLKIDPPLWNSCSLGELEHLTQDYKEKLCRLSQTAQRYPLEFLNHPLVIAQLLDKRECKRRLVQAGLAVTEMLKVQEPDGWTVERLLAAMRQKRICQVFVKPVSGSGAAGVSAFRWYPAAGRMALYTCALLHPEYGLVNTKRLRRFSGQEEVLAYLERILALDCVVERWYAKAEYEGYSYDLRAVVLDGRTEFLLGRLSKGPITNLHLNNHPMAAERLGLPAAVLEETAALCQKAAGCFPGLRSVGIDILLEKGSLRPRIIEMNAQGDLMYQDIFQENRIYRRQARMMLDWQAGMTACG